MRLISGANFGPDCLYRCRLHVVRYQRASPKKSVSTAAETLTDIVHNAAMWDYLLGPDHGLSLGFHLVEIFGSG